MDLVVIQYSPFRELPEPTSLVLSFQISNTQTACLWVPPRQDLDTPLEAKAHSVAVKWGLVTLMTHNLADIQTDFIVWLLNLHGNAILLMIALCSSLAFLQ